mmetsp:Transcript_141406/g.368249  ORF Transcript_141406/g.368249 Transcript_141406/m.368249 type:complete len:325 (+) Transcript_141406:31-1005(+)
MRSMPRFGRRSAHAVVVILFVGMVSHLVLSATLAELGRGFARLTSGKAPRLVPQQAGMLARGQRRSRHVQGALSEADATKIDGTPDELFYLMPRIGIHHTDEGFRQQLTQLFRILIRPDSDVLDLCSQHDSHLPSEIEYGSLTVHGMNLLELMANQRATARFTQNFNSDPTLGELADESMDAVLMTVSIQYMQRPVELFREVRRVLRPNGIVIVSFSNRMFFTKAVEAWRNQRSMRGLADLVLGYLKEAGFTDVQAANGVRLPSKEEASDSGGFASFLPSFSGDPFVAAVGIRTDLAGSGKERFETAAAAGVSWLVTPGAGSIW